MSKDDALQMYKDAINALHDHNEETRELVIRYFGLNHPDIDSDEPQPVVLPSNEVGQQFVAIDEELNDEEVGQLRDVDQTWEERFLNGDLL